MKDAQSDESMDETEDEDLAVVWTTEIERRAREVLAGEAELEDWEDVRARMRARLQETRS